MPELDRSVQRLLRMLSAGAGGTSDVAGRRSGLETLAQMAGGSSFPVSSVIDGRLNDRAIRTYIRTDAMGTMLYLHGGGWVAGSLDTHDGVCRRLAASFRCRVVALDYRRAPEHPAPAALDDAWAALLSLSIEGPVMVAGDSAGGALAASLCLRARDRGGPKVERLLLICPILDLAGETESRRLFGSGYFIEHEAFDDDVLAYCPDPAQRLSPDVSPLRAQSLAGLPPVAIHTAEFDPFRDEGEAFASRLDQAGVPVTLTRHPGMIHYFYALPDLVPYANDALAGMNLS